MIILLVYTVASYFVRMADILYFFVCLLGPFGSISRKEANGCEFWHWVLRIFFSLFSLPQVKKSLLSLLPQPGLSDLLGTNSSIIVSNQMKTLLPLEALNMTERFLNLSRNVLCTSSWSLLKFPCKIDGYCLKLELWRSILISLLQKERLI